VTVIGSAALFLLGAAPLQSWCNLPAHASWMRPGTRNEGGRAVPASHIFPVVSGLSRSVESLRHRPIRLLDAAEAAKLGGTGIRTAMRGQRRLRPYLVRAVYPTRHPTIAVRWYGDHLSVNSGGLGCFPFTNRPIIVLLNRAPKQLFVDAHAAL